MLDYRLPTYYDRQRSKLPETSVLACMDAVQLRAYLLEIGEAFRKAASAYPTTADLDGADAFRGVLYEDLDSACDVIEARLAPVLAPARILIHGAAEWMDLDEIGVGVHAWLTGSHVKQDPDISDGEETISGHRYVSREAFLTGALGTIWDVVIRAWAAEHGTEQIERPAATEFLPFDTTVEWLEGYGPDLRHAALDAEGPKGTKRIEFVWRPFEDQGHGQAFSSTVPLSARIRNGRLVTYEIYEHLGAEEERDTATIRFLRDGSAPQDLEEGEGLIL